MGLNLESIVRRNFRKILLTSAVLAMFNYCGKEKSPTAPEIPPSGNNPPTVEITSGPSGTISQDYATFSWRGSDTDGQVARYYRDLDDSTPDIETNETSFTFTNLNDGNHTFYVKAEDNLGAFSPTPSRSFRVDTSGPQEEEIQDGISDSNGRVNFSNTNLTEIDIYTGLPIQGIEVTYWNLDNVKFFKSEDPSERYLPQHDPFLHNSDHIIELTPAGISDYLIREYTGESLDAYQNWLAYIMTDMDCMTGSSNMIFKGTVSGDRMADYENVNRGLTIMFLDLLGVPHIKTLSSLDNLLDVMISDAITGYNLRERNWDKYEHRHPLSIFPEYMDIPSDEPSINQYPPEVSENSVTLTFAAFDSWTYPPPYTNVEDATIRCLPSTNYPNNDLFYWFKISDSSYSNWTSTSQPTITVTNLSEGYHEAQGRVKDDTNINEDISEIMPFTIEGNDEVTIIQSFPIDYWYAPGITSTNNYLWLINGPADKIAWHNYDLSFVGSYSPGLPWPNALASNGTSYIYVGDANRDEIIRYNLQFTQSEPHPISYDHISGLEWDPRDNGRLWSCDYEQNKIFKHSNDPTRWWTVETNYSCPRSPTGLAIDGSNLWSCNSYVDGQYLVSTLVKYNSNMTVAATYELPNINPQGVDIAQGYLWVTDDYLVHQIQIP